MGLDVGHFRENRRVSPAYGTANSTHYLRPYPAETLMLPSEWRELFRRSGGTYSLFVPPSDSTPSKPQRTDVLHGLDGCSLLLPCQHISGELNTTALEIRGGHTSQHQSFPTPARVCGR